MSANLSSEARSPCRTKLAQRIIRHAHRTVPFRGPVKGWHSVGSTPHVFLVKLNKVNTESHPACSSGVQCGATQGRAARARCPRCATRRQAPPRRPPSPAPSEAKPKTRLSLSRRPAEAPPARLRRPRGRARVDRHGAQVWRESLEAWHSALAACAGVTKHWEK